MTDEEEYGLTLREWAVFKSTALELTSGDRSDGHLSRSS